MNMLNSYSVCKTRMIYFITLVTIIKAQNCPLNNISSKLDNVEFVGQLREAAYLWNVDAQRFNTIKYKGCFMSSPIFCANEDDSEFYLRIYPNVGDDGKKFRLCFYKKNCLCLGSNIMVDLKIWTDERRTIAVWQGGLLNEMGSRTIYKNNWQTEISKNIIPSFSNNNLTGKLIISCKIKYDKGRKVIRRLRDTVTTCQSSTADSKLQNQATNNIPSVLDDIIDVVYPVQEAIYIWNVDVKKFNTLRCEGCLMDSPEFSNPTDDKTKWHLRIQPFVGYDGKKFHLSLHLSSDSVGSQRHIMLDLKIWTDELITTSIWHWGVLDRTQFIYTDSEDCGEDVHMDKIPSFSNNQLNGKLIISCKLIYDNGIQLIKRTYPTTTTHQRNTPKKFSSRLTSLINDSTVEALLQLHEVNYVWTIDQLEFNKKQKSFFGWMSSPTFSATTDNDFEFSLALHSDINENKMSLFLMQSSSGAGKSEFVAFELNIWSDEVGKTSVWKWGFPNTSKEIGTNTTFWQTSILKTTTHLFSKGELKTNLIISCKLKYTTNLSFVPHSAISKPVTDTDIVIVVNGTQYPAQKTVLAARSPVFAAKFEKSAKKGEHLTHLNITNINERVAGEMIRYIHTGNCENLPKIADQLLVAADEYGLKDLKAICAETLAETLTVKNAAKTLELAEEHGVVDLKTKTIEFISNEYLEVASTADWKRIIKKYPEFVRTVCSRIFTS